MASPSTHSEIIAALESNAAAIRDFFTSVPDAAFFDGDSDRWAPAHHLAHLTQSSHSLQRALNFGTLPAHPSGRSRSYGEMIAATAASLGSTPKDRLLELGRTVVISSGVGRADIVVAFESTSAGLRAAARSWDENALDRYTLEHPLIGALTVREMLFFTVFHERHHLKSVRTRIGSDPSLGGPAPPA